MLWPMGSLAGQIRASARALREALSNDGIRRLEISWMLGIGSDLALLVVLLVVVYERGGVVATGLLGAVRMVPAVASGMLSGAILERFRGERVLVAVGLIRAATAVLAAVTIALGGPLPLLFVLAAVAAAAGAPVRPTQATLMPAVARSPGELVAANMAWSTGEGIGGLLGPIVAGLFVALGAPALGATAAGVAFLGTAVVAAGLRFEQDRDATGGAGQAAGGLRLADGIGALRRRRVPRWTMLGVFAQVLTRGLLNSLAVVASVELLGMGDPGVGLLNGALGLGGLFGAIFAIGLTRADRLVRTETAALAYWGAPIAFIGLLPFPAVGLAAMVVIGVANAVFDVALFTIFQRGCSNDERAPVFSVFEGVVGLGAVSGSLLAPILLAAFGPRGALGVAGAILPIVALIIYSRIGRADLMSIVDEPLLALLREVPAFAELPLTAIERIAGGVVPMTFAAAEVLMRQGDPGDRFVVIDAGEIEVTVDGRPVSRLGRGAGVGEIALLRRSARTATVTALTDGTGYSIDAATFLAAISGPAAAAVTERMAAARLGAGFAEAPESLPLGAGT
jgi:MFS family permease